eukprot:4034529-Ditylum_brightwellii.AAC.1
MELIASNGIVEVKSSFIFWSLIDLLASIARMILSKLGICLRKSIMSLSQIALGSGFSCPCCIISHHCCWYAVSSPDALLLPIQYAPITHIFFLYWPFRHTYTHLPNLDVSMPLLHILLIVLPPVYSVSPPG